MPWQKVFETLGWRTDDNAPAYDITARLEEEGCLARKAGMGASSTSTQPTSESCGRPSSSRWSSSSWWLVWWAEWETTNVEFKRQLDLATKAQKAEFVRNILAVATTKSSGNRFLIIGFHDATRQFIRSVDLAITQNRLEQILNAYAAPAHEIRYQRVAWGQGEIGVVTVLCDPAKIPYRVMQTVAHITQGDVFVRHGSQVEPPTPPEGGALDAEGQAAALTGP